MKPPFFVLLLIVSAAWCLGESAWAEPTAPRIDLVNVPGSTAAIITVDGEVDAPLAAVRAVLCDYEAYYKFSRTAEKSSILSATEARELQALALRDRDDVEARVVPGKQHPPCESLTYVLTLLDYPFPLSDSWSLSRYQGAVSLSTFIITFKAVMGPDKGWGEFRVTPTSENRSRLVMVTHADSGVQLPAFLVRWALSTQLPRLFREIEQEAKLRARQTD